MATRRRPRRAPPDPADAAKFELANRLLFRLYQASNLMHKTGTRAVEEFDTTTQQWAVLGSLAGPPARSGGLTVKELINHLLLSRQNLTAVLDRLEAKDWVERGRDDSDGRIRRVKLSREGADVWSRMQPSIAAYYEAALAGFTPDERALLFRLLDRLKEGLNAL